MGYFWRLLIKRFAGFSDAGLQCIIKGLLDGRSNAASRDTISNDWIIYLVVSHVCITDSVQMSPSEDHIFVHKRFLFSIVTFQHFFFSNICNVSMLCV